MKPDDARRGSSSLIALSQMTRRQLTMLWDLFLSKRSYDSRYMQPRDHDICDESCPVDVFFRRAAVSFTFKHTIIVGSLSESRLKSVRFLVEESSARMTSSERAKIIKINH